MKVNRCVSFNVFIQKEHESLRPKVREALALYRAVMAKLYAVAVIAEEAGAEIIADEKKGLQVKPGKIGDDKTQRSKAILEALAGILERIAAAMLQPLARQRPGIHQGHQGLADVERRSTHGPLYECAFGNPSEQCQI